MSLFSAGLPPLSELLSAAPLLSATFALVSVLFAYLSAFVAPFLSYVMPMLHSTMMLVAGFHTGIMHFLEGALVDYGYIIVALAICIESMGVPFPGETMLLIASAYAANTGQLNIIGVIGSAAGGAIFGDSLGYWIGREGGRKLIRKYGRYVGLTDLRYQKAQDYLKRHGGKAVFFGRFVSIARTWIALLVGAHHLNYVQFLLYNVLGGIVWATIYGSLGYVFGQNLPLLEKWVKRIGISFSVLAALAIIYLLYLRKKRKKKAEAAEEAASSPEHLLHKEEE